MPEFKDIVQQSWSQPIQMSNITRRLHIKLARLAKVLKRWHKQRIATLHKESEDTQKLVLRLDQA
jgi:hypothetical protein